MVDKEPTTKKAKGKRKPDPSCHGCGAPIEIGKPVVIYHPECDPQYTVEALTDEIAGYIKESLPKKRRR